MPLFTVAIYRLYFSRSYSTATYLSLIPIVCGAGLTTVGDYHYSTSGLVITCLGVALAALKVCACPAPPFDLTHPPFLISVTPPFDLTDPPPHLEC